MEPYLIYRPETNTIKIPSCTVRALRLPKETIVCQCVYKSMWYISLIEMPTWFANEQNFRAQQVTKGRTFKSLIKFKTKCKLKFVIVDFKTALINITEKQNDNN